MGRVKTGNPTGRPPIDGHSPKEKEKFRKVFENLCKIQCTETEICGVLGCDRQTLINWVNRTYNTDFSAIHKTLTEGGKASLRRNQWALSRTNASMAIFLGKQILGQKDYQDLSIGTDEKLPTVNIVLQDCNKENNGNK